MERSKARRAFSHSRAPRVAPPRDGNIFGQRASGPRLRLARENEKPGGAASLRSVGAARGAAPAKRSNDASKLIFERVRRTDLRLH